MDRLCDITIHTYLKCTLAILLKRIGSHRDLCIQIIILHQKNLFICKYFPDVIPALSSAALFDLFSLAMESGRSTVVFVPHPSLLSTRIVPPIRSTKAFTIGMPSPVPTTFVSVLVLSRTNSSNRCGTVLYIIFYSC